MKGRWILPVLLVTTAVLNGCEFTQHYINKPWGKGTYIPAAACAALGGFAGAAIESQWFSNESIRSGTSTVINTDTGQVISTSHTKPDYPASIAIGAGAGAILCGLAGHYFLDKEPTPPPPPPPPTPEPPPPTSRKIVLRGVNFDFNKSDIRPDSRPVLDEAAEVLKGDPNVRISVEGYTDSIGSEAYNEQLSLRRADAVFRYLVNHGVAPDQMHVVGYGESRPVASNDTESGRAQNRRVELRVVTQPTGSE
jgi:OOP family OmpA-OmpF porin